QYWLVSGTSPACALTAGVAALIKSVYPALAPALVVQAITSSTSNKPHDGYDQEVGFGTVDATAALEMAGRLARDHGTGHGLVAAAQFGGGTAAIPPVPVAPRTSRQFLVDSLIALACLAVVLIVAFRLLVTRRPAAAGVPGGRASPGAPAGWAGGAPPDSRAPAGRAGAGPPDSRGPAGWAGGAPADSRAAYGRAGGGPPVAGPPDSASGAGGAWSDGGATDYSRPARYWAPGGYKPSAGYPSPPGYGSPGGVQPPADPGPPAGAGSAGDHDRSAASGQPTGSGASGGYQPSAGPGPQADPGRPASYGLPHEPEPPAGYGPPTGNGQAAGYGLSASPALPGAPGAPGIPAAFETLASSSPDAKTGRVTGSGEPAEPLDLGNQTGDPPAVDDDTWPSSGQW
ncbi:MAG TPA: S8 family serine peptidase, partial [Streptosporangiaceae bacterium]